MARLWEKGTEANWRPRRMQISILGHVYTPFLHDFLICNGGRKQVTEDAKELLQRELSATPGRKKCGAH